MLRAKQWWIPYPVSLGEEHTHTHTHGEVRGGRWEGKRSHGEKNKQRGGGNRSK